MKNQCGLPVFPYSELLDLISDGKNPFLKNLSKDIRAGIDYAFSTLDEDEQAVLLLRCKENMEYTSIAKQMRLSEGEIVHLEKEATRKLRLPGRRNYILYGIRGNLRMRLAQERIKAYREGFLDGYHKSGVQRNVPVPDMLLEELELSAHARQCLAWAGIQTVRELMECPEEKIRYMRNMGPKTASQIAEALRKVGVVYTSWDKFYPQLE